MQGISYSPKQEQEFREVYEKVLEDGGKKGSALGDVAAFSDADYAGSTIDFKSTSGSILYYRSTPV